MAEISDNPPAYSFSLDTEQLCKEEYQLLGNAILQGMKTGYFQAVAHPDRIFRRCDAGSFRSDSSRKDRYSGRCGRSSTLFLQSIICDRTGALR